MIENVLVNPDLRRDSVISQLHEQVELGVIKKKLDNNVLQGIEQKEPFIGAYATPRIETSGIRLSKDKIQQEMYSKGYRRVKSKEVDDLGKKYSFSQSHIDSLEDVGSMFFIPVFPEVGEDNLVVVGKVGTENGNQLGILFGGWE